MTNVKTLPGVKLQDDSPDEEVIRILESLLARAKDGGIRSLFFVGMNGNEAIEAHVVDPTGVLALLGRVDILKLKFQLPIALLEDSFNEPE